MLYWTIVGKTFMVEIKMADSSLSLANSLTASTSYQTSYTAWVSSMECILVQAK